jgi:hypothetical protein
MRTIEALTRWQFGGRRGGAPAWSPALLFAGGELGGWWVPSPATCFTNTARTTPAGAGGLVAGMTDLSGRGNHATQGNESQRPVLLQDSGGRWYLSFDGVNDCLVTPTITPTNDSLQIFSSVRKSSDATQGVIYRHNEASSGLGRVVLAAPGFTTTNRFNGGYSTLSTFFSASAIGAEFNAPITAAVSLLVKSSSGSFSQLRVNGVQVDENLTANSVTTLSTAAGVIGANTAAGATPFNGRIYGLVARYALAPGAADIAAADAYMASLAGITP